MMGGLHEYKSLALRLMLGLILAGTAWMCMALRRAQHRRTEAEQRLKEALSALNDAELRLRALAGDALEKVGVNDLQSARMAALGEMAAGLAHEINNPLTVISVQAQCLQLMVDNGKVDSVALGAAFRKIDCTIDRIARIVRGLRAFARDASHDPFEQVQLYHVIAETIEFCRARFRNNDVELKLGAIDPELVVPARPVQIGEVLLSLLNNAFDAVQRQPERWVEISAGREGDWWELRVRDSGPGVPESCRDRIMQPFFTTKGVGRGTGLGLSLSKGIAESHGGKLYLDTKSDRTEFVLRAPMQQVHSKEIAA